ncbi:hypothetical protein [Rhizobium sp. OAE497]|uniref:hypothetical protein n=1 Tax=Rhizobium sp. OAE497 TaxID=2663796 RepID=UPI0018F332FD
MVQPHNDIAFNVAALSRNYSALCMSCWRPEQRVANGGTMEDGRVLRNQLLTEATIHSRFSRMMMSYNEWKAARGR